MRPLLVLSLAVALSACDVLGHDAATIVRYEGPPITEADAVAPNEPFGSVGWTGTGVGALNGTFVYLRQETTCGDECRRLVRFEFTDPPPPEEDSLPETVSGAVEIEQGNPDAFFVSSIEVARVEIQDWGPEVYSGVVFVERSDASTVPARVVFWAEVGLIAE